MNQEIVAKEETKKDKVTKKITDKKNSSASETKAVKAIKIATPKKSIIEESKTIAVKKSASKKAAMVIETKPLKKVVSTKKIAEKTPKVIEKKAKETVAKKVVKKVVENKKVSKQSTSISFTIQLKFFTHYGQSLFVTGNHEIFGNGDISKALPMQYFNQEYWNVAFELNKNEKVETITYNYLLKNLDGSIQYDFGSDKIINITTLKVDEVLITDGWNYTGYYENAFYTQPFKQVLLKTNESLVNETSSKLATHVFQTKSPLIPKGFTLCLLGSGNGLHNWDTANPIIMSRKIGEDQYNVRVDLSNENFPVAYKYGVYDVENKKFIRFEDGDNRFFYDTIKPNKLTIINDAFANLPSTAWRGSGIAIPVFSLKTEASFGVGEFSDLKQLADWSNDVGLKLIQILPVNDTTATLTWQDCYPYAAISAFALHPIYINLSEVVNKKNKSLLEKLDTKKIQLNALDNIDYEIVINVKWSFLKQIFPSQKEETFASDSFKDFFSQNKHWLVGYSVFCYLRDQYGTANFNNWPAFRHYKEEDIVELTNEKSDAFKDISFHYFVQFHLHLQLKEATSYAHSKGIVVKGDIAIGVFRYGADAWQNHELFNMNVQAGAPPDAFAVKGQNWGFPTYNWQKMQEDGFAWWKQRFAQMNHYFDAFRIDHILGFFRIWSIPMDAVEGIMGYFVPSIPIHINEILSRGIDYNYHRFTQPYISESVIWEKFGDNSDFVKQNFLEADGYGNFNLLEGFKKQTEVEKHFNALEVNDTNESLRKGLYDLISNFLLFEVEGSQGQQFHPRFSIDQTSSFSNLDYHSQQQLKDIYVDYFFKRQDNFWMKEALQKLPALRRTTNMLICGEDLGLVPDCVPDVMKQLGLLSLEIQRMPKDPKREFFHPNDAPYLSVVTPSTHDMSTIRGWWEEDKEQIQRFYNYDLGQWGDAPFYCEGWINKAIVLQHLYSPAMWALFQFQDLIGIDEKLRRENPTDERINEPSNPKHYWRYRMNMTIEELRKADDFNTLIKDSISQSGR